MQWKNKHEEKEKNIEYLNLEISEQKETIRENDEIIFELRSDKLTLISNLNVSREKCEDLEIKLKNEQESVQQLQKELTDLNRIKESLSLKVENLELIV